MVLLPQARINAVGTSGEAVKPVKSDDAVIGCLDVSSPWEVAFSPEGVDSSELVWVDH